MRQVKIGKVLLTNGGRWAPGVAYAMLTYVTHNGDGWWSVVDNINSEPTDDNTGWVKATDVQSHIDAIKQAGETAASMIASMEEAGKSFAEAEDERVKAEAKRVADEEKRVDDENARIANENVRSDNETARIKREDERERNYLDAEERRDDAFEEAEESRQQAYAESEAKRKKSEIGRERAEEARVNNEETRKSTFEQAMKNAGTATALAEEVGAHPTYIGADSYVYKCDTGLKEYVKTDIYVKGDPLVYGDLTPDQIAELQKPANEMIARLDQTNQEVQQAEESRKQAEESRVAAENARSTEWATLIQNAVTATESATTAASYANSEATKATDAATMATERAQLATDATTTAAAEAENAKNQADYAKEQGDKLIDFTETVERAKSVEASLEGLIQSMEEMGNVHAQKLDIDELPTICGFPLFKIAENEPDKTPDFIGQLWINKADGTVYLATNCTNASGYKPL